MSLWSPGWPRPPSGLRRLRRRRREGRGSPDTWSGISAAHFVKLYVKSKVVSGLSGRGRGWGAPQKTAAGSDFGLWEEEEVPGGEERWWEGEAEELLPGGGALPAEQLQGPGGQVEYLYFKYK